MANIACPFDASGGINGSDLGNQSVWFRRLWLWRSYTVQLLAHARLDEPQVAFLNHDQGCAGQLERGTLFSAASFELQATAGLRWRLFDLGRIDAEVAQANSAHAQALLAYRQSVLRATEDVENAFTSLVQLQIEIRELNDEVNALGRARDKSQELYLAGASGLTDVLDAERQLLQSQDELARSRADSDRSAVASFRALGGGWNM